MQNLKAHFDELVDHFNRPTFIEKDPISIPHRFTRKQDIEIAGFFAAIFAWGQRVTIINKTTLLMEMMDEAPYDFIQHHTAKDLQRFEHFRHRTFQPVDALFFIHFLKKHYQDYNTLEDAFFQADVPGAFPVNQEERLNAFYNYVFNDPMAPNRSRKHVSAPYRKSTCKRMNMFMRWMVRNDNAGVDFGIWNRITPRELYIPLDVHVDKVARHFGLLKRKQADWKTVVELTELLRSWDPDDPVKYDYALFGMSIAQARGGETLK